VIARSLIPRLADIIEAIERINVILADVSLDAFENDWQRQWLVERGVEIISEASRHLPDDLKARNAESPWQKVAGIGNVLRHNYESIAAPVLWKLALGKKNVGSLVTHEMESVATSRRPPRGYQLKDQELHPLWAALFMSARSRTTISAARLPSLAIPLSACRTSSRSGGSARSQLNPASALVTAAVIASTISWACAL
jgi:uncharacterized protein with HEPN domain